MSLSSQNICSKCGLYLPNTPFFASLLSSFEINYILNGFLYDLIIQSITVKCINITPSIFITFFFLISNVTSLFIYELSQQQSFFEDFTFGKQKRSLLHMIVITFQKFNFIFKYSLNTLDMAVNICEISL